MPAMRGPRVAASMGDMTDENTPARKASDAEPRGSWKIPPQAWEDEKAMDAFVERIFAHMKRASERRADRREKAADG